MIVLDPLRELERPGPHRLQPRIEGRDRLLVDDLQRCRQVGQEGAPGVLEGDAHAVVALRLDLVDGAEEDGVRRPDLGIEQPLEGEGDVLRGERLVVVEDRVVDQLEVPGRRIGLVPALGQTGDDLEIGVGVDQLTEDVLVDLHRGVELGEGRIHVHRLVDRRRHHGATTAAPADHPGSERWHRVTSACRPPPRTRPSIAPPAGHRKRLPRRGHRACAPDRGAIAHRRRRPRRPSSTPGSVAWSRLPPSSRAVEGCRECPPRPANLDVSLPLDRTSFAHRNLVTLIVTASYPAVSACQWKERQERLVSMRQSANCHTRSRDGLG